MASKTRFGLIGLALVAGLVWAAFFQWPDGRLHLVFCDVGQGDAILVSHGSDQVLIDGGPDRKVLGCLERYLPFWDRQLEMVILTHPDADHLTGLIDVVKRYDVKQFVANSLVKDTAIFREWQQVVVAEGAPVYAPKRGDELRLGGVRFRIYSAYSAPGGGVKRRSRSGGIPGALNDTSIVSLLSFGNFDAFLSGDIGFDTEKKLVLADLPAVEVLKIPHHGSKSSSSQSFLEQIKPALAVISVGKNRFGHPTQEVLGRLKELGIKLLRTDQEGTIEIVSDGKTWYTLTTDD